MKCFAVAARKFRFACYGFACLALMLSALSAGTADAANQYKSSQYSVAADGGVITYSDANMQSAVPRVVRLASDRVLVVFTGLELEVATDVADRAGSAGLGLAANYMRSKFKFSCGAEVLYILPHTVFYDGASAPFSAFEIVTAGNLGVATTLSYSPDPVAGESESFLLAVPASWKLLGAFSASVQALPGHKLLDIELSDNIWGTSSGVVLNNGLTASGSTESESAACFTAELTEEVYLTSVRLRASDEKVGWLASIGGASSAGSGRGSVEVGLAPGVNRVKITLGSGDAAIPYTLLIIRHADNPMPSLKELTVCRIDGSTIADIPLEPGQLAYYKDVSLSVVSVKIKTAAGVRIEALGRTSNLGSLTWYKDLEVGANQIPIKLTNEAGLSVVYNLYVGYGNEAEMSDLKLYMVLEGNTREIPIRHSADKAGSGFKGKQGTAESDGWQHYTADLAEAGRIDNAEFYLVPTYNEGTRCYISNENKSQVDGLDQVASGRQSKRFTMKYSGDNLVLYTTLFRADPSSAAYIQSDMKVAVDIISKTYMPKLARLQIVDGHTGEQLLSLSDSAASSGVMDGLPKTLTTSAYAQSVLFVAEAENAAGVILEGAVNNNTHSLTAKRAAVPTRTSTADARGYNLLLNGRIDFGAHGEEKELKITVRSIYDYEETVYKLVVRQGYGGESYVLLGLSPKAAMNYEPSTITFDINGLRSYSYYDAAKNRWIYQSYLMAKVPALPGVLDGRTKTFTVDWTVFPALAEGSDVEFLLRDTDPNNVGREPAAWSLGRVTKNESGSGGTVELVLDGTKNTHTERRIFLDDTYQLIETVLMYAEVRASGGEPVASACNTFAEVDYRDWNSAGFFDEIIIDIIKKKPVVIQEPYPKDKRLPIVDFKLMGSRYSSNSSRGKLCLQINHTYKITTTPHKVVTYGDYKNYVKEYPGLGATYPYVFEEGQVNSGTIPERLEALSQFGAYTDTMLDNAKLDFSHDPITFKLLPSNMSAETLSDYVVFDEYNRTITPIKALPDDADITLYAATARTGIKRYVDLLFIDHEAANIVDKMDSGRIDLSFVTISPSLVYFGFKNAYLFNGDRDGYDMMNTPFINVFDKNEPGRIGGISYYNVKPGTLAVDNNMALRWQLYKRGSYFFWLGPGATHEGNSAAWRNEYESDSKEFGFSAVAFEAKRRPYVLDALEYLLRNGIGGSIIKSWVKFLQEATKPREQLAGPYEMRINGESNLSYGWNMANSVIVICSDPNEKEKGSDMARRGSDGEGEEEMDLSAYAYREADDGSAYLMHDGHTSVSMLLGDEASANESGRSTSAAEVEWAVPVIHFAKDIQVTDSEGNPISSDYSLFLDEVEERMAGGSNAARGASGGGNVGGPFLINFRAVTTEVGNMEISDFYVKMKGDDAIYRLKPEGAGENGGVKLFTEYREEEEGESDAETGGSSSGCGAGAGALAAAVVAVRLLRKRA